MSRIDMMADGSTIKTDDDGTRYAWVYEKLPGGGYSRRWQLCEDENKSADEQEVTKKTALSKKLQSIPEETYVKYAKKKEKILQETRNELDENGPMVVDLGNGSEMRVSMSPQYRKAHGFSKNTETTQKNISEPKKISTPNKQFENKNIIGYRGIILQTCKIFGIPESVLIQLLAKENRSFDPTAGNKYSSAYGIGQMISKTWSDMEKRVYEQGISRHRYLNRENPTNQILLAGAYLDYIREVRQCEWAEAMVFYHTGPNIARFNLGNAMRNNPGIAKRMPRDGHPTKQRYIQAAAEYYNTAKFGISPLDIRV